MKVKKYLISYLVTSYVEEYVSEMNLQFVRIFFETTTFDKTTKDRSAKFVDMLSAIGGTMGLLTGFSIISGVEILYFVIKIALQAIKKSIGSKSSDKELKKI